MTKNITCAFGVDVDAVAAWIGTFGGADSPHDISRGMFAGEVGSLRLLELFEHFGLKTTWLIPGHSIETFPEQMTKVVAHGHEVALHGYTHENPLAMTPTQEADVIDRCIELIVDLTGRHPVGYAAPWWELSNSTPNLLLERGIIYDHSMMHRDFSCYRLRTGDRWTAIDYSKPASSWMKPLERGVESRLIEIPVSWYLDDLPPMMFIKKSPNSHGFMNPKDIEELWREQFDWVYREKDEAVFTFCLHPDVAGRPQVLLMLERLIGHMMKHPGVRFTTLENIAMEFDKKHPFQR
ncbi:polysaccharide deacetylase family protein [Paraburkholderia sp. CNPSo 3157]|uniref:Polysaccharide deacetylase family protein n=1 Tax=Paraburkholderia franconis TaxID=2654983 RepID=A0A7X1NCC7_9BURK|nr:polysaccharide deacetylase [Paraburkholderia franconis]MPW19249.1 polysaccharide deacetylase family protein [Paraburkholderia franconis]